MDPSDDDYIAAIDAAERERLEQATDREFIQAIRDAERRVAYDRQRGRIRRTTEDDAGNTVPIPLLPKRPLEYQGPHSEEDYPLIYVSERMYDYTNPDPSLFELGKSSGRLKLENEHIRKLIPGMSATVTQKQPIFR